MSALAASAWCGVRLPEAMAALMPSEQRRPELPGGDPMLADASGELSDRWVVSNARCLGLDAVAVSTPYAMLGKTLSVIAPAVIRLPDAGSSEFLLLLDRRRGKFRLLGPDLVVRRVDARTVRDALYGPAEADMAPDIDQLLRSSALPTEQARTREALLTERLRHVQINVGWVLRRIAGGPLADLTVTFGVRRHLACVAGGHAAGYMAWIAGWMAVGQGALLGRLDAAWLAAAGLLFLMFALLRIAIERFQMTLSMSLGLVVRRRMFDGSLLLDERATRGQGIGQFLGRIFEAQSLEALAVSGGFSAFAALFELVAAGGILALVQAWAALSLLILWAALCGWIAIQHLRARLRWTAERRHITHELIERMLGHRTRLAQHDRTLGHALEDDSLVRYLGVSQRLDGITVMLGALVPRGWLCAGFATWVASFVAGAPVTRLAVMVAALLMAYQGFRRIAFGVPAIAGAWIVWKDAAPLLNGASAGPSACESSVFKATCGRGNTSAGTRLEAVALTAMAARSRRHVLEGVDLQVRSGDRVLLQGPSGGGKSTLAAILAGLRRPSEGTLLLDGLDLSTLGAEAWSRRVALAPQFQENHVFTGSLAFNLLMARGSPPTPEMLDRARQVCLELGLGDLLDRMPSGIHQMVGENGWQLSHGERSRVFIARALLQGADFVILDESLAALDPHSVQTTLDCIQRRACALIVIAHP